MLPFLHVRPAIGALGAANYAEPRSGGWLEGDGVSDGLELGDEPTGFPFGVQAAGEIVGAEFVVGLSGGQDVPDDDDHRVGYRDDGFLFAVWPQGPWQPSGPEPAVRTGALTGYVPG